MLTRSISATVRLNQFSTVFEVAFCVSKPSSRLILIHSNSLVDSPYWSWDLWWWKLCKHNMCFNLFCFSSHFLLLHLRCFCYSFILCFEESYTKSTGHTLFNFYFAQEFPLLQQSVFRLEVLTCPPCPLIAQCLFLN